MSDQTLRCCWWHTKLCKAHRTCQISLKNIFNLAYYTVRTQGSWWFQDLEKVSWLQGFFLSASFLWNNLPADIRQSGSIHAFKSKPKTYLSYCRWETMCSFWLILHFSNFLFFCVSQAVRCVALSLFILYSFLFLFLLSFHSGLLLMQHHPLLVPVASHTDAYGLSYSGLCWIIAVLFFHYIYISVKFDASSLWSILFYC